MKGRIKLIIILDLDEEVVRAIYSHQLIDSDFLQFLKGRIEEALIEYNRKFREIEAMRELDYKHTIGPADFDIDPAPID